MLMRDVDGCYCSQHNVRVSVRKRLGESHRKTFTIRKTKNILKSRIQIRTEERATHNNNLNSLNGFQNVNSYDRNVGSSLYLFSWAFVICLLPPAPNEE